MKNICKHYMSLESSMGHDLLGGLGHDILPHLIWRHHCRLIVEVIDLVLKLPQICLQAPNLIHSLVVHST